MKQHSPCPSVTDGEAKNLGPWQQKRGPRSEEAEDRRKARNTKVALLADTRRQVLETSFLSDRERQSTRDGSPNETNDKRNLSFTEVMDTRDKLAQSFGESPSTSSSHFPRACPGTSSYNSNDFPTTPTPFPGPPPKCSERQKRKAEEESREAEPASKKVRDAQENKHLCLESSDAPLSKKTSRKNPRLEGSDSTAVQEPSFKKTRLEEKEVSAPKKQELP